MSHDPFVFRVSFWPLFRFFLAFTVAADAVMAFVIGPEGLVNALLVIVLPALGAATLVSGLLCIIGSFTAIRVTEEGLHGPFQYGHTRMEFLSWAEMESVRPMPLSRRFGVPIVCIHSFQKERPSISVPLFLTRFPAFRQAVRDAASPLNPLRKSLENGCGAADRTKIAAGL